MDINQYDKDNLRNLLIDYIACARFIKDNYEIDKKQRKTINNQARLANMYIKKLSKISALESAAEEMMDITKLNLQEHSKLCEEFNGYANRSDDISTIKYKATCTHYPK